MIKSTQPQLNVLETFNFEKTTVIAGNMTMGEVIALKPVVENLGLDWSSQLKRLKRDDPNNQLWSQHYYIAEDAKKREMVCMNPINFQNWLYGFVPSQNFNTTLWEEYKKGLVVHLLMMLKISLDEITRLRSYESKYHELKDEFIGFVDELDEGKELSRQAKEKFKNSNDRKKRIFEILHENDQQLKLF